ncbi:hypothetical protein TCE0_044f17500 [Talaromyces pinophilus]|uniref:Myb-like domain-containing protein n=1 Tax=Talaromyces pinophilus TaxID=128442 RepID=A0A478ED16_TALPI|nr:hypothetical protein TCE0_044f17500 [Talaromyces pinophilus]
MVNWTPELILKFLLMTLQQISPQISGETWKKVADVMGDDISAEACRQKYAKLLGAAGIEPSAATSTAGTPATPKSARKRKDVTGIDATPSKTASTKKQRKAQPDAALKVEEDEGQAEELVVPPTPFVKKFASADESD